MRNMAPQSGGNTMRKHQRHDAGRKLQPTQAKDKNNAAKAPSKYGLPFELQQLVLDVVKDTFKSRFNAELTGLIQEVKQHLYTRDFASAFGKEAFLEAYAMRWSPSRALAYADLLSSSTKVAAALKSVLATSSLRHSDAGNEQSPDQNGGTHAGILEPSSEDAAMSNYKIVCLGGGAGAELLVFAAFLNNAASDTVKPEHSAGGPPDRQASAPTLSITAVDIADWSSVLGKLYDSITITPSISKSISLVGNKVKTAFVDADTMDMGFQHQDILNVDPSTLGQLLEGCRLVTLMFTLNELYSTSMSSTTKLLLSMTELLECGSLLLVVDSPGSYSTVNVGQSSENETTSTQKKYPMKWLLEHTLLEVAVKDNGLGGVESAQWEKVDECGSRWFRLPKGLKYPIGLEDMRYQYHLYKRT